MAANAGEHQDDDDARRGPEPPVLLVVEDDHLVRLTLVDALSDGGFEVLEADDAEQALALVCDHAEIAAMLTDINLPGGSDGFALAHAVRVIRPDLPVIYASGRFASAEAGSPVEGSRFLAKPFTPALAFAAIEEMLGATPPRRGILPAAPRGPARHA